MTHGCYGIYLRPQNHRIRFDVLSLTLSPIMVCFLKKQMPRAGFAEDGHSLLLQGMSSDSYTSVTACVVSALVLLHSRILHKRKWKRPRVHTETAAMATFVGGGLLLIGRCHCLSQRSSKLFTAFRLTALNDHVQFLSSAYPLEESFAKVFLVDSLSMSLSFAVVQASGGPHTYQVLMRTSAV
jgi:hypothetical protein